MFQLKREEEEEEQNTNRENQDNNAFLCASKHRTAPHLIQNVISFHFYWFFFFFFEKRERRNKFLLRKRVGACAFVLVCKIYRFIEFVFTFGSKVLHSHKCIEKLMPSFEEN